MYLHGIASGDFELALRGLLGEKAPMSASTVARVKQRLQAEYSKWEQRFWNHGVVNVLTQVPKQQQGEARELLIKIPYQTLSARRSRRSACFRTGALNMATSELPS